MKAYSESLSQMVYRSPFLPTAPATPIGGCCVLAKAQRIP